MNDAETTLAQLRERMRRFVAERRWEVFHDPKNLAMSIAVEAAELMEHFQWARSDELAALLTDEKRRAAVRDELADVLAFTISLANALDVDLSAAFAEKMSRNEQKYPAAEFQGRYEKPQRDA